MTTFNTGNPLGSTDVYDRYDNSENLDNFSNGPLDAYPDRFGVPRQSLQGIRNASQYQVLGAYAAGLQFTSMNQAFSYLGEFYAPGPSIVLPYTTTGVGAGEIANFRSVGDAVLRQDLASSSDPLKGSYLLGYKGRTVRQRLANEVWADDFPGFDNTGATDSFAAVQAAVDYVAALQHGGVVRIPTGQILISGGTITNNREADNTRQRVSIVGEDQNGTRIIYTGAGNDCFQIKNSSTGPGEGNASHQIISDMTIIGPSKRANSSAITIALGAFMRLERLNIQGFDFGIYLEDVDQFSADNLMVRFNKRGITALKKAVPTSASTQPNNHTYKACTIASNDTYGALWVGGSCINLIGGDVEYNGTTESDFGLKFTDCGYEGARGANIIGTYFEGNTGIADVFIEAITVNVTPILDCVHYVSADFKRLNSAQNSVNHIVMAVGPENAVGAQRLVTSGCGFKEYTGYVPSAANRKIAFSNSPATANNYTDLGSFFGASGVEKPDFVQSLNKFDAILTKTAAQTFATGVTTKWLIDTVVAPSTLYTPNLVSNEIIIAEAGTYSISAFVVFAATVAGIKFMLISKNNTAIGFGEATGSATFCSVNATLRCAVGDAIKVQVNQATGGNLDVAGGGSSASGVNIVKLFG